MSDQLCDLLNEFYQDIRPDLVDSVFSAIKAAQSSNEFVYRPQIFEALRRLILNLSNPQQDDTMAINIYMTNNATYGSSTRPFFYNMIQDYSPIYNRPIYNRPIYNRPIYNHNTHTSGAMTSDEWAELFLSQPSFPHLPSSFPSLPYSFPSLPSSFPPLPSSFPSLPSSFPPLPSSFPPLPSSFPPLPSFR
jgi:hypothetical protein